MSLIEIEWSTDEYECEVCGSSYSEGAVVHIDEKLVYDQPALAHCYDSNDYCEVQLRQTILKSVGLPELKEDDTWLEGREFIKYLVDNNHEVEETTVDFGYYEGYEDEED